MGWGMNWKTRLRELAVRSGRVVEFKVKWYAK